MCLEVKVGSPLFHTLSIKVNVEFCSFFRCLLDVLWNLTGLHFLMILLLHLLQDITKTKKQDRHKEHFKQSITSFLYTRRCGLTEYSLAILCRSLSCRMTEYSECLEGYSLIIRSITSSLRRAVKPANNQPMWIVIEYKVLTNILAQT